MSKIYKYIIPKSEIDPNYEIHEFLICWFGKSGGWHSYLFTDIIEKIEYQKNISNRDNSTIFSLTTSKDESITIFAEDLNLNDFKVFKQLPDNNTIIRLLKDGTKEIYSPLDNTFQTRLSDGRFSISIEIAKISEPIWN